MSFGIACDLQGIRKDMFTVSARPEQVQRGITTIVLYMKFKHLG